MKRMSSLILASLFLFIGCTTPHLSETVTYQQITAEQAKSMMEELTAEIVLDVREPSEYAEGHIQDAVLLPVGTITKSSIEAIIPSKETVVLVYCRSGNRSKQASQKLVELGYTKIYEFGGINAWPYEVESSTSSE